jgi:hypothetical protein
MAKATTTIETTLSERELSDETLRDMLKVAKGFRRDNPGEPWVCMPEPNLFTVLREFASNHTRR